MLSFSISGIFESCIKPFLQYRQNQLGREDVKIPLQKYCIAGNNLFIQFCKLLLKYLNFNNWTEVF